MITFNYITISKLSYIDLQDKSMLVSVYKIIESKILCDVKLSFQK